jgi:hypothetical protein
MPSPCAAVRSCCTATAECARPEDGTIAQGNQAPETRPAPARWRSALARIDKKLAYVLAVPLLLAAFGSRDFFFDSPGWIDPFVYVGYFLHYPKHLPLFDDYYKVSRLPWVLPGCVSFHLFGPLVGTYVLQLGTLALGLGCLSGAVRDSLDEGAALLTVLLLGTCTCFHGSGGWNYHNGAATAYFLATVLCLTRAAAGRRAWAWYFLAGAALASVVLTNLFMAAFVPGLVLHYVLSCRSAGRRLGWTDVPAGVAGMVAITGVLTAVHRATGGHALFFMPQITYTLLLSRAGNGYWQPLATWLPVAFWLAVPVAAVFSCPLAWLLGRPWAGARGRAGGLAVLSFQLQGLLALAAGCYWEFVKRQTVLEPDYMAACFLGPAVLPIAAFFYSVRDRVAGRSVHRLALVGLAVFTVPLLATTPADRQLFVARLPLGALVLRSGTALLPVALTAAGVAVIALRRRSAGAWLAGLALLSAGNLFTNQSAIYNAGGPRLGRDAFHFLIEADRFTRSLDPSLVDIKYWFEPGEIIRAKGLSADASWIFHSYVSTRGWLSNLLGGVPTLDVAQIQASHLAKVHRLGVLSATPNQEKCVGRLRARFAEIGYALRPQAQRSFRHGDLDLTLGVFWIEDAGRCGPELPPAVSRGTP